MFFANQLFLRGMPHLCDRMRRLTAKDIAKRKIEGEVPLPDLNALSRDHPLPESEPNSMLPPLSSASVTARAATLNFADEEDAILEKRRDEITSRITFLVASKHSSHQATASVTQAPPLVVQPYQNQAPMRSQAQQQLTRDNAQSNPGSNLNAFFQQTNQCRGSITSWTFLVFLPR